MVALMWRVHGCFVLGKHMVATNVHGYVMMLHFGLCQGNFELSPL
jgi:hypothetical protein